MVGYLYYSCDCDYPITAWQSAGRRATEHGVTGSVVPEQRVRPARDHHTRTTRACDRR